MVPIQDLLLILTISVVVLSAPWPSHRRDPPDFDLTPEHVAIMRRAAGSGQIDFDQSYLAGGNVQVTQSSAGYEVNFQGAPDFFVGKGWQQGDARNVTFTGNTTVSSGTGLVAIYGWMENPLTEYYIQEYANGQGAAQGQQVGTLQSDGSLYRVWKHMQVNQPSIVGTTNFNQYISQRVNGRPNGGTVTLQNHFDAWKRMGLVLGILNYQVLATEGWGNADGQSKYTLS